VSDVASGHISDHAGATDSQDSPLNDRERKMVARLLSDPTYFPIEFRNWIKTYLEGSGIQFPSSAILAPPSSQKTGLPPGAILPFGGGTIPPDCKICDGAAVSRTTYAKLFAAIGTAWGVGDGTATFNLPDLRDRALYGAGAVVGFAATDGRALGSRGGPSHSHEYGTTSDAGGDHDHSISGGTDGVGDHAHLTREDGTPTGAQGGTQTGASGTARYTVQDPRYYTGGAGDHSHSVSGGTSTDGGHNHWVEGVTSGGYDLDQPSFAGIHYIIAMGVIV